MLIEMWMFVSSIQSLVHLLLTFVGVSNMILSHFGRL